MSDGAGVGAVCDDHRSSFVGYPPPQHGNADGETIDPPSISGDMILHRFNITCPLGTGEQMVQANVQLQLMEAASREEERARKAARLLPDQWHEAPNPRYERLPRFIRHSPIGADTIEIWQPHGGYWRIYWGGSPIVRHHHDLGC